MCRTSLCPAGGAQPSCGQTWQLGPMIKRSASEGGDQQSGRPAHLGNLGNASVQVSGWGFSVAACPTLNSGSRAQKQGQLACYRLGSRPRRYKAAAAGARCRAVMQRVMCRAVGPTETKGMVDRYFPVSRCTCQGWRQRPKQCGRVEIILRYRRPLQPAPPASAQ